MTYFEVSNKKQVKEAFIWPLILSFSSKFGKGPDFEYNMAECREEKKELFLSGRLTRTFLAPRESKDLPIFALHE